MNEVQKAAVQEEVDETQALIDSYALELRHAQQSVSNYNTQLAALRTKLTALKEAM